MFSGLFQKLILWSKKNRKVKILLYWEQWHWVPCSRIG